MKKRILSVVLILAMMLSLMAVPAGAAVTYKDWSNVYWTSADDGLDAIPSQYSFTLADDTKDALGKTPVYQVIDSEEADGKKNYLIIRLEAIAGRGRISTSWRNEPLLDRLARTSGHGRQFSGLLYAQFHHGRKEIQELFFRLEPEGPCFVMGGLPSVQDV